MQNVSANYDRAAKAFDHYFLPRIIIDDGGTYTENKIVSVSTNIQMMSGSPEIGKAIAGEITVSILNPTGTIPKMARMRLYVRACGTAAKSSKVTMTDEDLASTYATYSSGKITFSSSSGATVVGENLIFAVDATEFVQSEWIQQGVYYIDTREITQNEDGLDVLTIHGFDAMLKAEQDYAGDAVGGDYDTAYVSEIAAQMGVSVDPRTWDIMQGGHIITMPLGYSCREILGFIAGLYVGSFIISDEGKLRLVSLLTLPPETNLLIDEIGDVLVFGTDAILI